MRKDMAKVVTESPRFGHSAKSMKTSLRVGRSHFEDDDHGSTRHPIARHRQYKDPKSFSDLLGPLRKYFRKQVGRPWDNVYSELSQTLDKRSVSGLHIWDHIKWEVDTNCYERDGKIFQKTRWSTEIEVTGLYVHPRTRLLCFKPYRRFRYPVKRDDNVKKISDTQQLERIKGIWYLLTSSSQIVMRQEWDGELKEYKLVPKKELVLTKKQLSKKEKRDYGV